MSTKSKGESEGISRREFLKETGLILGGVTLASLSLASCGPSSAKTTGTTTGSDTTPPATSADTAAPTSSNSSVPASSTPATGVDYAHYLPSTQLPQLLAIPNCTTKAAADRLYSEDNMWILNLSSTVGVVGMSDKFQALVSFPKRVSLPQVGEIVTKDIPFGTIEGSKLNTDLVSPVSGTVLDRNDSLITLSNNDSGLQPIVESPYTNGWMIVVQMSKPDELNRLLSPAAYVELVKNLE